LENSKSIQPDRKDSRRKKKHDNPYKLLRAIEERICDYLSGYYGPQALQEALRMVMTLRTVLKDQEAEDATKRNPV